MASSSGARLAATSFCIELRKPSGAPSSAARKGSGATSAPSATPMAHASLTHFSKRAHQPVSERTARYRPILVPKATRDQKGGGKTLLDPRPLPGGKRRDKRDRVAGSGVDGTKKGFAFRSWTSPRGKVKLGPRRARRVPEQAERRPIRGEQDAW